MIHRISLLLALALSGSALAAPVSAPPRLAVDFNNENPWTSTAPIVSEGVTAKVTWEPVGTYDTRNSDKQSPALCLRVDATGRGKTWQAGFRSGPLPIALGESNLGKITLAFDLSANLGRPVGIIITSLDDAGLPTGALRGTVYPAAPNFIHRHTLDLSTLQPEGPGKFVPTATSIELSFTLDGNIWPDSTNEVRLDNVSLSGPAYYVSPKGSDTNDGRTEDTAFATPQRAIKAAAPGDIILLREGTYEGGDAPVISFVSAGTPAAWISLKIYPGERATLHSNGWNIVNIGGGSKEKMSTAPALAYLEVRGIQVRGDGDTVEKTHPELLNKSVARVNSNGIAIDGRYETNPPHHIRFADNVVEFAPGQGVGALEADWVTMERNQLRNNCYTTIFATSGISTLGASNFDSASGIYKMLIRDNVSQGNETKYIWASINKYSDGNGIILDINISPDDRKGINYLGRTLVQNNLVFDNGGAGIHCVGSAHIDIIGNTVYHNSRSPHLEYGAIDATWNSNDVRIINNIMVARVADEKSGEKPEPLNTTTTTNTNIVFRNNLYFGGNVPPDLGEGDKVADPMFVMPSVDPKIANFRLLPGSPAIGAGVSETYGAFLDLAGQPHATPPSIGAYEFSK